MTCHYHKKEKMLMVYLCIFIAAGLIGWYYTSKDENKMCNIFSFISIGMSINYILWNNHGRYHCVHNYN